MSNRRTAARIAPVAWVAVVLLATVFLASCGIGLVYDLDPPAGVAATIDQIEQITLTWSESVGANIYYVYRSTSPAGPFGVAGEYGLIPYRTVVGITMIDLDVDPTTYYYRVSSGNLRAGSESAQSATATGSAIARPIGWQDAANVFGADGTVRLDVDRLAGVAKAFVLTAPGGSTSTGITGRALEDDGTLTILDAAFESVDGTDTAVADIAVSNGEVYAAAVSVDLDRPDPDRVYLWKYDNVLETWFEIAGPLAQAHATAPYVDLATVGSDELLLAYRGSAGDILLYHYVTGTFGLALTPPSTTNDVAADADDALGQIVIAAEPVSGTAFLAYELEDDAGLTTNVYVTNWLGAGWSLTPTAVYGAGDIPTGSMDVAIDPVTLAGYAVTFDIAAATPEAIVTDVSGTRVAGSEDLDFLGAVDITVPGIALSADNIGAHTIISLFYSDATAESGVVRQFDENDTAWSEFSPADFTQGSDVTNMHFEAASGKRYAAFTVGAFTRVRAYQ